MAGAQGDGGSIALTLAQARRWRVPRFSPRSTGAVGLHDTARSREACLRRRKNRDHVNETSAEGTPSSSAKILNGNCERKSHTGPFGGEGSGLTPDPARSTLDVAKQTKEGSEVLEIHCVGKSGQTYKYIQHDCKRQFLGTAANFLFVRVADQKSTLIYAGSCENLAAEMRENRLWKIAVEQHGATDIYAHISISSAGQREAERDDLSAAYNPPLNP